MMFRNTFVALLLVFVSCVNQKQSMPNMLAEMSRSSCMGPCPVYSIQIFDNGLVRLEGTKNVEYLGSFQTYLTQEQLEELKTKFLESDFFNFQDQYTKRVSDLPTTKISYTHGDQTKSIIDYYGAPEELKNLENYIHGYLELLDWSQATDG